MFAKKKAGSVIDYDKAVPTPEEVSVELASLQARQAKMVAELHSLDAEQRDIARKSAADRREDDKRNQIDALITGSAYEPPADMRDRMAAIARRRALINDAMHELSALIRAERTKASRLVIDEFRGEQKALATEFYKHLAAAVAVHSKFGNMKQRLERAGVDSSGLHDFARDLMGPPNVRNDHASYALRDASRRGYIDKANVPGSYL